MNIKKVGVVIIFIFSVSNLFSQITGDTTEIIIYEYDTVYVAADTIFLAPDTIFIDSDTALVSDTIEYVDSIIKIKKRLRYKKKVKNGHFSLFHIPGFTFTRDTILVIDTIRSIDTITRTRKQKVIRQQQGLTHKKRRRQKKEWEMPSVQVPSFIYKISPNSIDLKGALFYSGSNSEMLIFDTLLFKPDINKSFSVQLNYSLNRFFVTVGAGFTPYKERYSFYESYYSSNKPDPPTGSYDSLLITNSLVATEWFNCFDIKLGIGYSIISKEKFSLQLGVACIYEIILPNKKSNEQRILPKAREYDVSINVETKLTYKILPWIGIFVSPFYQQSIYDDQLLPYSAYQKYGVGFGLNIISKK